MPVTDLNHYFVRANDLQDTVLGADESSRLFAVDWDDRLRRAFPGDDRLDVRICYCSFLRECWISRAGVTCKAAASLNSTRTVGCRSPRSIRLTNVRSTSAA
jgi:hypothetical protein